MVSEPSAVATFEAIADILVRQLPFTLTRLTSNPNQWVAKDCPVDGEKRFQINGYSLTGSYHSIICGS